MFIEKKDKGKSVLKEKRHGHAQPIVFEKNDHFLNEMRKT